VNPLKNRMIDASRSTRFQPAVVKSAMLRRNKAMPSAADDSATRLLRFNVVFGTFEL